MATHARRTPVILQSAEEVRDLLLRLSRRQTTLPHPPIELRAESIPEPRRREMEARLTGFATSCGCGAGNVAAAGMLLLCAAWLAITLDSVWSVGWRHAAWTAAFCVAGALAGKVVVLARARARLIGELGAVLNALHGVSLSATRR